MHRKHEADRRTFRIPAPRMGNTDVPADDGYTWRKYGQKEILGSKFPRYKSHVQLGFIEISCQIFQSYNQTS